MGQIVEFVSNGDTGMGYLARPASGSGPGVIVLQEWWGLVPHITDVADRFAEAGFTALVPDLYRGESASASEPNEAAKLMMTMNLERAGKDMSGAVDFLQAQTGGGKVGVVGFCMGGGLALVLGCQRSDAVAAVAPFYGLIPWPGAQPDYSQLTAAVQGHYAERDNFASPTAARALEAELTGLGRDAEFFVYDGSDHAFFNDERPEVYNAVAAQTAWDRTILFFCAHLAGAPTVTTPAPGSPPAEARPPAPTDEQIAAAAALAAAAADPDAQPKSGSVTKGVPSYRGGHVDTSVKNFPFLADYGIFKTGWILLGDDEDGPSVAVVELGPGIPEDEPHFHNSAQVRIFISGSLRIGTTWYKAGDMRVQQAAIPYGPELVGPDGCVQVLFWSDRRGMFPHYREAHVETHKMQLDAFAAMMASTGVTAN
jgi:carboxymethylenebutenolidase